MPTISKDTKMLHKNLFREILTKKVDFIYFPYAAWTHETSEVKSGTMDICLNE